MPLHTEPSTNGHGPPPAPEDTQAFVAPPAAGAVLVTDPGLPDTEAPLHPAPPPPRRRRDLRRVPLFVGRVLLWALVLILLLRGVLSVVADARRQAEAPAPAAAEAAATPAADAARAFAAAFALEYLTFDPRAEEERATRLGAFLAEGIDPQAGWDTVGSQVALQALPVAHVPSAGGYEVTVATRLDDSRWLHLAVPVAVGSDGALAVPRHPAIVPPPARLAAAAVPEPAVDRALSQELAPTLASFFTAYAAGNASELAYYTPVGATVAGLDGTLELAEVVDVRVYTGAATRDALVTVRWRDSVTGAALTQAYPLRLITQNGRWYVERVGGGAGDAQEETR